MLKALKILFKISLSMKQKLILKIQIRFLANSYFAIVINKLLNKYETISNSYYYVIFSVKMFPNTYIDTDILANSLRNNKYLLFLIANCINNCSN